MVQAENEPIYMAPRSVIMTVKAICTPKDKCFER
jgi:hypothetical protein